MTIIEAILVAIVEGLTEFLPISSTGHMIITQSLLNIESSAFVKAYTIIIQFGAILSVVVLYWERFFKLNQVETVKRNEAEKLTRREKSELIWRNFTYKFDFYLKLLVALMPAIILGVILGDVIDNMLESVTVVAIMLIIGGVFMLFVDRWFNHPKKDQSIDWIRALKIGFFQCIAMIPGVSRSMATIVGGMGIGLNRKNAAEFSFFLAVPTMAAAAGYKIFQLIKNPTQLEMLSENILLLVVGNLVAFIVAIVAIRFFINFLTKYGFRAFGYYRIVVGGGLLFLIILDMNVAM